MALQSSSSLRSPPPRRAKALIPGSEGYQGTSREGSKRRGVTRKCCKGTERGPCFVGQTPCISRITISCACIRPCTLRQPWRLGDQPLATRVAIRSGRIADPCILGEPFMLFGAQRAECAAEEYWGGVKGLAVSLYASGNGSPCLGAADHHYTHWAAPSLALVPIGYSACATET